MQEDKKCMHLCISWGWYTFCEGLQIQIAGLHTFLGDLMCQIGDLLFKNYILMDLVSNYIL